MHAVGFQHEHSRNDRDNFVKVVRNNIQGGKQLSSEIVILYYGKETIFEELLKIIFT